MLNTFEGLMDWPAIDRWISEQPNVPGRGPITAAEPLLGGSQNVLFLVTRDAAQMVLRRPPRHLRPNSNTTMLRESRVLEALAGSAVPHAEFFAVCDDTEITGACFYLMAPLEGYSPKGPLPPLYANNADWRRAMGKEMINASAALARVDHIAAGLADFGKPENWHARQVGRWRSQLEGYREGEGYNPGDLDRLDAIGAWLGSNLPVDRRIGIIHGDYQWPNVMFSGHNPRITGLIDWELCALGDPMLDLGWMLTSWIEPGDPEGREPMITPWSGQMSRAEIIDLYCSLTERDPSDARWFFVLACYKLGCILEGSYARGLAGKADMAVGLRLHGVANWLFAKAAQLIN